MFGIGTILNVVCIVAGGMIGMVAGKLFSESLQDTLMKATGVCVLFLGIAGTLEKMMTVGPDGSLSSGGTMVMIASMAIGTVIGELLRIEYYIERFGAWLKIKSGNAKDVKFIEAFVNSSLTVCIGAMAVVGSIQDGIFGDYSILLAKAILDLIIIAVMASSMGKGCAFSAIPVGIFQGTITVIAHFAGNIISEPSLNNLSFVGSMLIFCVGVNLIWGKLCKVANMLPALAIAVVMTHVVG